MNQIRLLALLVTAIVLTPTLSLADVHVSGLKHPNHPSEGDTPVTSDALAPDLESTTAPGGFDSLIPYLLASPDQEEAGSCLYMSLTGIAEWWLARLNPSDSRAPEGPLDLSERYLMNLAGVDEDSNGIANWKTDSIDLYNRAGRGVLNHAYRFTKGWTKEDEKQSYVAAKPSEPGASYSALYNWIDRRTEINGGWVPLPRFEREVLFADPESNQWNVGIMPAQIIDRVKRELIERQAPVHVIYNHYGYWHAVMIVGFDEARWADGSGARPCPYVESFRTYMRDESANIRRRAEQSTDPKERARLTQRAERYESASHKVDEAYAREGGCHGPGAFYVRDSIYASPDEPIYDYDLSRKGEEAHYSKKVILREYDWLRYVGNHATSIFVRR